MNVTSALLLKLLVQMRENHADEINNQDSIYGDSLDQKILFLTFLFIKKTQFHCRHKDCFLMIYKKVQFSQNEILNLK